MIKTFIFEYNRSSKSPYRLMAYWTRPGFGILNADGIQATSLEIVTHELACC